MNRATRPALGETVHYVGVNGTCRAAMVVGHPDQQPENADWSNLDLLVFSLQGSTPEQDTPYATRSEGPPPGTWHWGCGRT